MNKTKKSAESLLSAWLKLSATVRNERIVTGMTFNEAYVCNLLLKNSQRGQDLLSATDLCHETDLLKSQMNKILNDMEQKGYITKTRSGIDKRVFLIKLEDKGLEAYKKSHEITLGVMCDLVGRLGLETADYTTFALERVSKEINSILKGGHSVDH